MRKFTLWLNAVKKPIILKNVKERWKNINKDQSPSGHALPRDTPILGERN